MGILTTGPAVKNHISPKKRKRIECNLSNYVPLVVPTTPTPTSSASSSQDSVFDVNRYTENQYPKEVKVRVRSYRETRCIEQTETENTNRNEGREEVQSNLLHDLPDWLQGFREILVDDRSPFGATGKP